MNKIRLTESQLHKIIKESVNKVLNEAADPIAKIQSLIQQANDAYHEAAEAQGGDPNPLMDKDGTAYGLQGDVRLDGRGYVIIPFTSQSSWSEYTSPAKIRVLTKAGGRIKILNGDYMTEGWKDAAKMLKSIIKHAQIGIGNFQNYDASWENSDTPEEYKANKAALRDMNKKIGRRAGTGVDYIGKNF